MGRWHAARRRRAGGPAPARRREGRGERLLRTDGITKAYGGVQALDGCTMAVDEGTITGLIGPNGSGKTTLFNVITGYERPDAGEVCLGGQRITERLARTGYSRWASAAPSSSPGSSPGSRVIENMLVAAQHQGRPHLRRAGQAAERHRALELLEFVGIARHDACRPGTLSYGQRKLLELAYVLVADPAVILLDEPAGGVNPTLVNHIAARIRELNASREDVPDRRAQHGVRDGPVHRIAVLDYGHGGRGRAAGHRARPTRVLDAYLGAAPRRGRRQERPSAAGQRPAPLLVMDGVVAGYGGGDVLHGVSLRPCRRAAITCVVGPNGAGKSTVLARSAGCSGRGSARYAARRAGAEVAAPDPDLGMVQVPQNHSLFRDMTVRENIDLGGYTIRDRALVARRRDAVDEMFPQVAAGRAGRPAACPAASSGWSSSPAA